MEIAIKHQEEFIVAGLNRQGIDRDVCPAVWYELYKKHDSNVLRRLTSDQPVGVCYGMDDAGMLNYLAGFAMADSQDIPSLFLDYCVVPAGEYAVIVTTGPVPLASRAALKYFFREYKGDYSYNGGACLEIYLPGDLSADDYQMEIWIPVQKAENATN
ncbi:hypothetical protein AWM75_08475 [Aerococcus urinaehominis]|uniref:AraC effector-binding domain-containing protein n=1 Tax=Aerococcus urinaehominis TaxID=128944 RepID=A0A0X8FMF6_9LACT|nr:GyrI-like domain-containing protein [Aerococcus urinaehominis]AMC00005.1 hypothetical protein AWM75_08475 [Aerococcus urinaehominis]